MKKILLTLGLFTLLGFGHCFGSPLPVRYDLEYNLCNYSYNTSLNQIISQDFYTILGYAGNNPICYQIMYYDPANLYSFRSNGNSYLEYRSNNSIYDFGNCASTFSDLMNRYDLSLSNGDQQMCNQIYNGNLQMYVSFYFPYNAVDCSSIQSDYDNCKSSLNSLSGSLATCNSSLSSCESDLLSCQNQTGGNMTSSDCQTEYNLIPISSVDSAYCLTNNLCPLISTGEDSNWSALFINNIQHNSAGLINITIPSEISWDYTGNSEVFDLEIDGYNVDSEYIEGVINKQNYTPTTEDLSNVVSNLGLFGSLLVVCLFVILVFYMIKKIFH